MMPLPQCFPGKLLTAELLGTKAEIHEEVASRRNGRTLGGDCLQWNRNPLLSVTLPPVCPSPATPFLSHGLVSSKLSQEPRRRPADLRNRASVLTWVCSGPQPMNAGGPQEPHPQGTQQSETTADVRAP